MTSLEALFVFSPAAVLLTWYWFQVAKRAQREVNFRLRRSGVALISYVSAVFILQQQNINMPTTIALSGLSALGITWILVAPPKRSRRIPKKLRRAVIERDLGGAKFDPALHDIDHIVPYSKGGDHSEENLRVTSRSRNRSRGNKMPGWRDLF